MRGYERDEYEDWDEYEDEEGMEQDEEEGGEDEYEEPPQPTQEELEYLELRQRLKESIRKQMKKDLGTANAGSRDKISAFRKDNYGSFFGPSQPVIAQRVIQESKSLLENPDLAARITKPKHTSNKSSSSAPGASRPRPNHTKTVTNGLKKKVEILKNTRDYSFLLSEDSEVPASAKAPQPRNVSASKSDARSAPPQLPRHKQVANDHNHRGREIPNGRDVRKPVQPSGSQNRPKVGMERTAHSSKSSIESRKQPGGSNNGSGPGRPVSGRPIEPGRPNRLPSKSSVPTARNSAAGGHRPNPSSLQAGARKPMTSSHAQSGNHRPAPSRSQSQSQHSLVRRPALQEEASKPKVISKQPLPSSRDQMRRPPPKPSGGGTLAGGRPKPKPKRPHYDDGSDDENAINMIRQMFGYNPNKFQDADDDSDMEANFDDIMREEKRSAKIARKEDEEQLRLIEEEEKRERMRLAKKRKLGH